MNIATQENSILPKAVILFNMGGPNSLDEVEGFLFNIFHDKYMISLPNPFRYLLAKFISKKRVSFAKEIYKKIGNKSPILEETNKQAKALEHKLGEGYKVFVVMRYSFPFIEDILPELQQYNPDSIILLPLYPQYCSCTTLSSIESIKAAMPLDWIQKLKVVCCYYKNKHFIESHCSKIRHYFNLAKEFGRPRILFSAHGIPQRIVDNGDPYEFQINQTVKDVVANLNIPEDEYKWNICYQSKVGRLKWLEPSTEALIHQFAEEVLILVPIAFTSEHSETLVELDIEYAELSKNKYFRVPALGVDDHFIECLTSLCVRVAENGSSTCTKKCYNNMCNLANKKLKN